jgi:hypothetical protein
MSCRVVALSALASLLLPLLVLPARADTAPEQPAVTDQHVQDKKPIRKRVARRPHQVWHGYGFLPGYRTPERIDWDNARARGPQIWYGPARWYHGQWNHGGFGPCYTETPIGEIWNCGK